ncbi:hypothetical protein cypCar_00036905 [Cyprinus carpio]|nr:hypothetical protein cypCar_00036905 [Cyprinus carpio]
MYMCGCFQGCLFKLREDISKTLEKVSSCEKYLTTQLEHHISEYRQAQAQLNKEKELYQQASGSVTERSRILAEISEDLEKFKQEMEEKGSSMSESHTQQTLFQATDDAVCSCEL